MSNPCVSRSRSQPIDWIFPMAGKGKRTREFGDFKPLIEISGRYLFEWMLLSVRNNKCEDDRLIFVTSSHFERRMTPTLLQRVLERVEIEPSNTELLITPGTPPGPAATVYAAEGLVAGGRPVVVVNCDQFIDFTLPAFSSGVFGLLPVYVQFGHKSSFVEVGSDGRVIKIVEKENISNIASAGVYAVRSGKALMEAIERQEHSNHRVNGEFYVGPSLNYLIDQGHEMYPVPVRAKYDLGDSPSIRFFADAVSRYAPLVQAAT